MHRPHPTRPERRRARPPVAAACLGTAVLVVLACLLVGVAGTRTPRSGAAVPRTPDGAFPVGPPQLVRSGVPTGPGQVLMAGAVDWGDPAMVQAGGTYYLYSTQPLPWIHVPVEHARAGGTWSLMRDALPTLPAWAQTGRIWAPDVHRFGRRWVLYFSAQVRGSDPALHCLGEATGRAPGGPFRPAVAPLYCQPSLGGSIDPRVYVAPSGVPYLVWKSDNNTDRARYGPTVIWSARLRPDGLGVAGTPTAVFAPDRPWEGMLLEAPDLVTVQGRTWLFFSGGEGYWSADYAIGAARCRGPLGPCADVTDGPILSSNAQGTGPGEESVFVQGDRYWLVYNTRDADGGATPRPAAIAALSFRSGVPVVVPRHTPASATSA